MITAIPKFIMKNSLVNVKVYGKIPFIGRSSPAL